MAELVKVEQKSESDQLQQMVFDNADFGEVERLLLMVIRGLLGKMWPSVWVIRIQVKHWQIMLMTMINSITKRYRV